MLQQFTFGTQMDGLQEVKHSLEHYEVVYHARRIHGLLLVTRSIQTRKMGATHGCGTFLLTMQKLAEGQADERWRRVTVFGNMAMLMSLPGVSSSTQMREKILQEKVEWVGRDEDLQEQTYEQKNNVQTWWEQDNDENGQTSHKDSKDKDKQGNNIFCNTPRAHDGMLRK